MPAEQVDQLMPVPVKPKGSKKRINFASVTCGAKIVAANPEAQNPSYILIENKDQYMINDCKVKKVYVVSAILCLIVCHLCNSLALLDIIRAILGFIIHILQLLALL